MRIAFYAPLKSPTHATPSGDRRVAGLFMEALERAAGKVELVSTFRSLDADGDAARQQALRAQGQALAERLVAQWRAGPPEARPSLWFTYHVYYKAPDWLGPAVSAALRIPYVIAEASFARKRAGGAWALGHDAAADSIRSARLVLAPSRDDIAGLEAIADQRRIVHFPPFVDVAPYRGAAARRDEHRARLAAEHALDPEVPWIVVAAMMRPGDKLASYRALAASLSSVVGRPWRLLVAGDGSARAEVEAALQQAAPGRACYLGTLGLHALAEVYAASDLCAWPAVNEAYGMALLEAQAAGVPVVACARRGVPDVVVHRRTGLLTVDEIADPLRELLANRERRAELGRQAGEFVAGERSLEAAAERLRGLLAAL